ncbi:MAG: prepilin-type N-terminal cleavage/methylation domain-containing protein [Rugosibacter sp.]|nr:MAG: prepilin-type N-terminal cleavage/methylation domain-containing protein [Rugosibacter sp.]TBR07059.1 MAG: prepilin-type N-terminal cleavage/methylation domain-containing protein [Rugosibacter sp.]
MRLPLSLSRFRHKPQTGFTLVELIMVMVLMGILATVALPRFNFSGFNEVGFRDKLKATIEFARKSAVAQRRITCIALAGNSLALTIDNVPTDAPGAGTCPRQLTLPTSDAACGGPINAVCAPNGVVLAGPVAISFDPLGRPSAAAAYTVTGGTSNYTINVTAETGYVR